MILDACLVVMVLAQMSLQLSVQSVLIHVTVFVTNTLSSLNISTMEIRVNKCVENVVYVQLWMCVTHVCICILYIYHTHSHEYIVMHMHTDECIYRERENYE